MSYGQDVVSKAKIGAWLRQRRDASDISQEGAARVLGVSYKSIANWEQGKAPPPADKFLELAILYRAVAELPSIVANWERVTARGEGARGSG